MLSVEDVHGQYRTTETYVDEKTGQQKTRDVMKDEAVIGRIVDTMQAREKEGKEFG